MTEPTMLPSLTKPEQNGAEATELGNRVFASKVFSFSTQYATISWSANQVIGMPDTYPNYGDITTAWASQTTDGRREFLLLGYDTPAPINAVYVYETYNPGAVDTVYVRNSATGVWQLVWSGTAAHAGNSARIFTAAFQETAFSVDAVRLAINSPAVAGWNQIDAVGVQTTVPSLAGTYRIGPGRTFENFNAAVKALNVAGVAEPVVFEVDGGVYQEQIEIPAITGVSARNTITFKSATTDTVKLQFEPAFAKNFIVRLVDADYLRFEGIYFNSNPRRTFTSYGGIFLLAGNVDGLQIRNCTLAGSASFSNFNTHILIAAYSSARTTNLVIERNVLQHGSAQLYLQSAANNPSLDSEISSNRFVETWQIGIYLERHRNARIFNNFVTVANIFTDGSSAIHLLNSPKTLLYHNSVYSKGLSFFGTVLFVDGASTDSVQVKNNIFMHANDGYAAWFSRQVALHESDYNVFHTTGSSLIRWVNDKTYADLRSFQAEEASAARFERNSLNVDPGFSSLTKVGDLHTKAPFLDGKGTSILRAAVLTDIDGENRSQLTPVDIGADAFIATQPPLAGIYTIGAGNNYPNFTAAVAALKMRGVSAPVTFTIRGGVYAEQIEIPPIGGASATNTITFKPASTDTVKLQFEPVVAKNYVVRLAGADHIVFDGIYFDSNPKRSSITSNTYGNIFSLIGGIESVQIRNCELRGFAGNSNDSRYALVYAPSSAKTTNLRIEKNTFLYGSWQVYLAGNANNPFLAGEIFSNRFVEAQHGGIYLAYNRNARVFNNFVTVANTNTSNSYAVQLYHSPKTSFYHNSIQSQSSGYQSAALLVEGARTDSVHVKNNILAHANHGYAAWFYNQTAVQESDYNVFHTTGGTLIRWVDNKEHTDLTSFKAAANTAPFERNSLEANPGFALATPGDLHLNAPFLDAKGTPALRFAVLTDIDDGNRNSLTPVDIGADAYVPTQQPLTGNYSIGTGGNFPNFKTAIDALKTRGVSSPVTFTVRGGIYAEQFEIPAIGGASATNTITFKSILPDTAKLRFESTFEKNYIVRLAGADHVIFEGIAFDSNPRRNTTTFNTYGNIFALAGGVEGVQIRNCLLQGFRGNVSDARYALISAPQPARTANLRFAKNIFRDGSWQIYLEGKANDLSSANEISANRFVEAGHGSLLLNYQQNARVFNNFVTVANTNTNYSYAVQLYYSPKTSFYHNSVYSKSSGYQSAALLVEGVAADSVHVKNNILVHAGNGYAAWFYNQVAAQESDYNVLHSTGGTLIRWVDNKEHTDLASFKAVANTTRFERNSLEVDPGFALTTPGDLHTRAPFLDQKGTPALRFAVLTDIDDDNRNSLTPVDIGADAYVPTQQPLTGNYSIGTGGNYPNFKTAVDALKMRGVSAPVTFTVQGSVYAEQFEIPPIGGASTVNTITFKSILPDTAKLRFEPTTSNNYIVRLAGADHIIFDGLSFDSNPRLNTTTFNTYGNVFSLSGGVDGVQIRNCTLRGFRGDVDSDRYALVFSPQTARTINLRLEKNVFQDGSWQVYLNGKAGDLSRANEIAANRFVEAGHGGILLNYHRDARIFNNFVTVANTSTNYSYAIQLYNSPKTLFYHNSVYSKSRGYLSTALFVEGAATDSIHVKNNILVHANNGQATWFYNRLAVQESDFNVFNSTGSILIRWVNDQNYADLASFKADPNTASFERNSLEVDPGFTSAASGDLHTKAPFLDARGTPNLRAAVLTDIDGEDRSSLTPVDVGADAYRSALAPLAGTYVIGSNGNYPNFKTAIEMLKMAGVAAPLVFAIKGGAYTEQIEIPAISGVSAANTITFRPLTTDTVKIQFEPTVDKNYVVRLSSADHVNFDGLVFNGDPANNNNGYGRVFSLAGAVEGLQIRNCIMSSRTVNSSSDSYTLLYSDNATKTAGLSIKENIFSGGTWQIYLRAADPGVATRSVIAANRFMNAGYGAAHFSFYDGVALENNKVTNAATYGFSLAQCDSGATIRRNELDIASFAGQGIYLASCSGPLRVVENKIVLRQYGNGIYFYSSSGTQGREALVANNFLSASNATSTVTNFGLRMEFSSFVLLYHNSVHLATRGSAGAALTVTSSNIQVKNNALANLGGGYAVFYNSFAPSGFNYNALYTSGPTLMQWSGRNYANLAAFKADNATAPAERNSIETNPLFRLNAPDDLHTRNGFLDAKGTLNLTLPVAADIDGEDRTTQTPVDLGADAFVNFIPGDANIAISDNRLDFGAVYAGTPDTLKLIVSNLGNGTLDITSLNNATANFSFNKTPFSLSPNQSRTLLVIFTPKASALYTDTLKIASTDPDTRVLAVALRGEGFTQPDLSVARVLAPPAASSGLPIQINWTVANLGNDGTKASQWYDEIYLLDSPVFDFKNDVLLGRVESFSALGAGEAYANAATFTLPRGISGNYYIFVRTDLYNQERERREDNNHYVSAVMPVTLSPYPDLQIAGVVAPDNAFSGDSVQIRWTVKNNGTGRTAKDKWSDTIFLSKDDSLDFAFIGGAGIRINETVMAIVPHTGTVETGASYTTTARVKMPHAVFGKYFFFVYTDLAGASQSEEGEVYEYNFELNNWNARGDSIRITLTPPADLTATKIIVPATASLGEDLMVQWTVKNEGSSATFEIFWDDRIYLSRSAAFKPDSALVLGDLRHTGILPRDSSYTAKRAVRIPAGFSGPYYLFVKADANNNVFEYQSDNNNVVLTPAPFTINAPNLVPSEVEAPPSANSGKNIDVNWKVTNRGPGSVFNYFWNDRIYLSKRPEFRPDSAVAFGSFSYSAALRVDSSYTGRRTFTIPNGFSGEYYIFVETDADNRVFENLKDNDNRNRSNLPVRIDLSPWPDLQVTGVQAPQTARAGDRLTATWTVTNKGRAATESMAWTDYLYLSPGLTYDPGKAILLATAERNRFLEAAANYAQSRAVNLAVNLAGTYTLSVRTDGGNAVYEHTDEGNNFGHSRTLTIDAYPPVNLAVSNLSSPAAALSGSVLEIKWQVENIGQGATLTSNWVDRVYLSLDKILDRNNDLPFATISRSGALRPAEKYLRTATAKLPNGIAGDYFVMVDVDAENAANDSSRSNNLQISATPLRVTLAPSPDLVITKLRLPKTVNAGQPLTVTYTVENHGNGTLANAAWYDAFYLSNNTTLDANDPVLAFHQKSSTLAPKAAYTDSVEVEMPSFAAGTYFLIAKTDSRNEIYEHNAEQNNVAVGDSTGVKPVVVIQPQPADLIVSNIIIPANAVPGEEVTIAWTLKNIGANRALGRLSDVVYISPDTIFQVEDPVFGVLKYSIDLAPGASVQMKTQINLAKAFRLDSDGKLTETLPGLTPGNYHAIVRTNVRNNIRESSNTNNALASTGVMSTDVAELKLGVPVTGKLAAGDKRYYKLRSATAGATIQIDLQSSDSSAANEVYVAFNRTPDLNDFDFGAIAPQEAHPRVTIPSSQRGDYFLLLNSRSRAGLNAGFILRADSLRFAIHSVETNVGGNTGQVTVKLTGAKFDSTISVMLENGSEQVVAHNIFLLDETTVLASFSLNNAELGLYDVKVKKPSNEISILKKGFKVVPTQHAVPKVEISHPAASRPNQQVVIVLKYRNISNIDISVPKGYLISIDGAPIARHIEYLGGSYNPSFLFLEFKEQNGHPNLLRPTAESIVTIYTKATNRLRFSLIEP